ncbi:hypothetical protein [Chitinophaga sp.]|uniref:hypothetical protein n=1 Tax=Chitinophaga sp. TaxID=1869181 RepID=UPI0031E0B151
MLKEKPPQRGLVVVIQLTLKIEDQIEESTAILNIENQLEYPYQYSIVSWEYQVEFRFLKPSEGEPYKIEGIDNPSGIELLILRSLEQNQQSILLQGHLENYRIVSR